MLIVKKFGGTSVANKERIFNVARRCIEDYKKGHDVIVVLSAMGKYTDELVSMAKDINPYPPKREIASKKQEEMKNSCQMCHQTRHVGRRETGGGATRSVGRGHDPAAR